MAGSEVGGVPGGPIMVEGGGTRPGEMREINKSQIKNKIQAGFDQNNYYCVATKCNSMQLHILCSSTLNYTLTISSGHQ